MNRFAFPSHELQVDRPAISVRDRGKAGVTEVGPPELKADGLGDLELAAALHEHPALAKVQDAPAAAPAPTGAQGGRQVFGVASRRSGAGELHEPADRRAVGGAKVAGQLG